MRLRSWPLAVLVSTVLSGCGEVPTSIGAGGLGTSGSGGSSGYNLSWGDGRRTVALYGQVDFTYTPVLSADAPANAIRDFTISHQGEVTIRRAEVSLIKETYTLTATESKAWQAVLGAITFDYGQCPTLPGARQPHYTWVDLGGQYAGRPNCPPNPVGLTMLLAPETLTKVNGFLNGVSTRLLGAPLI